MYIGPRIHNCINESHCVHGGYTLRVSVNAKVKHSKIGKYNNDDDDDDDDHSDDDDDDDDDDSSSSR